MHGHGLRALLRLSNYFYTFPAWPPLIVGVCSLLLGFIVLVRERASYASRAFAALCTCVALWLMAIGMLYSARDSDMALFMAQVSTCALRRELMPRVAEVCRPSGRVIISSSAGVSKRLLEEVSLSLRQVRRSR